MKHIHIWEDIRKEWSFCVKCGLEKWIFQLPDYRYLVIHKNDFEMRKLWQDLFLLVDKENRV